MSAVASGLNLGLMSLDMNELAVISSCGDSQERKYARTIAPVRRRGNFLLCSLLLSNVMVNSTLTVILETMTTGLIAVIGSTLAIVILGEIVPQAICARKGLAIGAQTIYLTYAFMFLTAPLSYPISILLDCVLGEEKGNVYDRERLMEFIKITGHHTQLDSDEVAIISGALKLKKIKVDQIMTRIEDVFMLPMDCNLDRFTIKHIIEKGYSRIPIYDYGDRRQIVALILAKDLALLDPDDQLPLAKMIMYCKHPLIFIEDSATLDVALNEFKTGKSHMAVVRQIYDDGEVDKYYEAIGIVTLEDVIEEVLQTEINDETDTLSDNRRKRRRTDAQVAHLLDVDNRGEPLGEQAGTCCTHAASTASHYFSNLNSYRANQKDQSCPLTCTNIYHQHGGNAAAAASTGVAGAPNDQQRQSRRPARGQQLQRHQQRQLYQQQQQPVCVTTRTFAATCQHFVVALLTGVEQRFRSFMLGFKDNISKLFVSCVAAGRAGETDQRPPEASQAGQQVGGGRVDIIVGGAGHQDHLSTIMAHANTTAPPREQPPPSSSSSGSSLSSCQHRHDALNCRIIEK